MLSTFSVQLLKELIAKSRIRQLVYHQHVLQFKLCMLQKKHKISHCVQTLGTVENTPRFLVKCAIFAVSQTT